MSRSDLRCSICGGTEFRHRTILWPELVAEWQLASEEEHYVNRQQGTSCIACGSNLRSIALADAIRAAMGTAQTLMEFVKSPEATSLALLEINEAGDLSAILRQLPGHVLAAYPEVDMRALPYADGTFDFVVHSDTLEHIVDPLRALEECRRVLRPGAFLCFTIPTIVGRLSRSREGLPKSYHGSADIGADDFMVQTEFGADVWTYVLRAGFTAVSINAVDYPAALAMSAREAEPAPPTFSSSPRGAVGQDKPASGTWSVKPPRVVSVHFPKAAGSSLKAQFAKLLEDQVFLDYDHDPLVYPGRETVAFPYGKRLVHGHFHPSRYASADAYWMTFLRQPVDNLISIYSFWRELWEPLHGLHARFLRERPSILEFATYPGLSTLMSETYFGNFDMRRFDLVGFYETRDADLHRVARDLVIPLLPEIYENKTDETQEQRELKADMSIRRRLTDLLAADVAFYERLRR